MGKAAMVLAAAGMAAQGAAAAFLMVVDSGRDQVHMLDALDGSVVQVGRYDIAAAAAAENFSGTLTPKKAVEVGEEVWVSDQGADRIWRFNKHNGRVLGSIGNGVFGDVRGFDVIGDTAYIATGNDVNGVSEGLIRYSITNGTVLGVSNAGLSNTDLSLFDVVATGNGELLVSNADSGNDAILRFDLDGGLIGQFASSDGIDNFDFLQQLSVASDGDVLAASFSLPSGVFRFATDGTAEGVVAGDGFGPRGVFELDNGEVLYSAGVTLRTDDAFILDDLNFAGGSFQYITALSVPAPGAVAVFATVMVGWGRRRGSSDEHDFIEGKMGAHNTGTTCPLG